jgi:hypothetical protein
MWATNACVAAAGNGAAKRIYGHVGMSHKLLRHKEFPLAVARFPLLSRKIRLFVAGEIDRLGSGCA